jgi:tRNA-guanine family transglycosylase
MKELSAQRLLTIHNLRYTLDLVSAARQAIVNGVFPGFVAGVVDARGGGSPNADAIA